MYHMHVKLKDNVDKQQVITKDVFGETVRVSLKKGKAYGVYNKVYENGQEPMYGLEIRENFVVYLPMDWFEVV